MPDYTNRDILSAPTEQAGRYVVEGRHGVRRFRLWPHVKKAWIADLTSGRFKQGRGTLRQRLDDGTFEYCCMGVLCNRLGHRKGWQRRTDLLGKVIYNWFGHGAGSSAVPFLPHNIGQELAAMNDNQRRTFPEIAKYIEKEL